MNENIPFLVMPGHPRYQPEQLQKYFGYDNLYREVASVEFANLQTLGEIGHISGYELNLLTPELVELVMAIPTREIDYIERNFTKHDIRAWVKKARAVMIEYLEKKCGHELIVENLMIIKLLHAVLTSFDALDNARILQFLKAYRNVISPSMAKVVRIYIDQVRKHADILQIGRTHGQHALPITVGFWEATILSRMIYNWMKMDEGANGLLGKISGGVGAENPQVGLGITGKCGGKSFEERVLEKVGLKPAPISTQILQPEPLSYFLFACIMESASIGQLGRDCRHLMRSEIEEILEEFEEGQEGSSTMAQKRNPITFENLEGTWIKTKNEFGKVLDTQISEHQRDLVGSSVARDFPIILINLQHQLDTLLRKNKKGVAFLERITVSEEACKRNFQKSAGLILAEPIYIALQMAGYQGDAHELVNKKLVPIAKKEGYSLAHVLNVEAINNSHLAEVMTRIPQEVAELFWHPDRYTGRAKEKALEIADMAEKWLEQIAA